MQPGTRPVVQAWPRCPSCELHCHRRTLWLRFHDFKARAWQEHTQGPFPRDPGGGQELSTEAHLILSADLAGRGAFLTEARSPAHQDYGLHTLLPARLQRPLCPCAPGQGSPAVSPVSCVRVSIHLASPLPRPWRISRLSGYGAPLRLCLYMLSSPPLRGPGR